MPRARPAATTGLLVAAAALLAGCAPSRAAIAPDFGMALNAALAAQIADPDAAYVRETAPGADGARAGLAQERYRKGQVTAPRNAATSTVIRGGAPRPPAGQ